jgi:hypothetical protein
MVGRAILAEARPMPEIAQTTAPTTGQKTNDGGTCPSCRQGDLIMISMAVGGRDLTFSTCHLCEAKWWYREGQLVPLTSVIDMVVQK